MVGLADVPSPVCESAGRVLRAELQLLMALISSVVMVSAHASSVQLLSWGMRVLVVATRLVQAFWASVSDLFITTPGKAPAKAIAPAARTVKMVESCMAKRFKGVDYRE